MSDSKMLEGLIHDSIKRAVGSETMSLLSSLKEDLKDFVEEKLSSNNISNATTTSGDSDPLNEEMSNKIIQGLSEYILEQKKGKNIEPVTTMTSDEISSNNKIETNVPEVIDGMIKF